MEDIVQLFATCLIDSLFPQVGEAVVKLLRMAGARVSFPASQTCCGQPAYNAGFHEPALKMAKYTIDVFSGTPGSVVVPSGSCAAMIRHGYLELFRNDPIWLPRAEELAGRTFEFSEFLVNRLDRIDVDAPIAYPRLAYHPSCHLMRDLGIHEQPLALLKMLEGVEIEELKAECCGFGGVFAIDHPEISSEMLARRMAAIQKSEADVVVSCDVSCLMQLEGGLRHAGSHIRCMHLAQILAGQESGLR